MDCYELVSDVLEKVRIGTDGTVVFSEDAKAAVHVAANHFRETAFYKATKHQNEAYRKGKTAGDIYKDMIIKMVNAPTGLHRTFCSVLLCDIDDLLQEDNKKE